MMKNRPPLNSARLFLSMCSFLSYLVLPLVLLVGRYRLWCGKEILNRYTERFGHSTEKRLGKTIWIHGASVGEVVSSLSLIERLLEEDKDLYILVTSHTVQAANILKKRLPQRCIHQFMPYDTALWMGRFLDYWKPLISISFESDLWPNKINETNKRHIPQIMLNACMSPKSAKRWACAPFIIKGLWPLFEHVFVQSSTNAQRLSSLGLQKIEGIGNLKYAAGSLPYETKELERLKNQIGDRPIWAAVSTHKGEESIILSVHKRLKKKFPHLLTLIAIRHPERSHDFSEELKEGNYSYALRSSGETINDSTELYCFNTIGEMGLVLELAKIVFVGGSFIPLGGHNPIEPALHRCCIITGPYIFKSVDIYKDLKEAVCHVQDEEELGEAVSKFLTSPQTCKRLGDRAFNIVKDKSINLDVILKKIKTI